MTDRGDRLARLAQRAAARRHRRAVALLRLPTDPAGPSPAVIRAHELVRQADRLALSLAVQMPPAPTLVRCLVCRRMVPEPGSIRVWGADGRVYDVCERCYERST